MLGRRNGFFAFESALLVRPYYSESSPLGIVQWNAPKLWKGNYGSSLPDMLCFAEDAFGVQFCIHNATICSFDPETAVLKEIARSIGGWAGWILEDHKVRTGWPLAHFWQLRHGPLRHGGRLLPKVPFVLGGQFTVENLYELNDLEGMRVRADIATQLKACPDGSKVVIRIRRGG
ncbi:MAG: SMI1/KNR4 family protein [Verrucomicrobia bacterium]|nr:MAG: SMI1/KNR4 family protein [Verrucomicrobiota bacterium]